MVEIVGDNTGLFRINFLFGSSGARNAELVFNIRLLPFMLNLPVNALQSKRRVLHEDVAQMESLLILVRRFREAMMRNWRSRLGMMPTDLCFDLGVRQCQSHSLCLISPLHGR